MAHASGHLAFDRDHIAFLSRHHAGWSMPVSELAIVGEYTTAPNAWDEAWSVVFVVKGGDEWFSAPMIAVGTDAVCGRLAKALGTQIHFQLGDSEEYKSAIAWPPELKSEPLFEFTRAHGRRIRDKILYSMFPKMRPEIAAPLAAQLSYYHAG